MNERYQQLPESITVRADAGPDIGYGHLRRTLSVVGMLKKKTNLHVRYAMTEESDATLAESHGCEILRLPGYGIEHLVGAMHDRCEPLLVDTYSLGTDDLHALEDAGLCTILFDDGKRLDHYPAAMVVDYAPGADRLPYFGLANTRFCLGPSFYPLRTEFFDYQKISPTIDAKNVLITFGGSDPDDQTARVLQEIAAQEYPWTVTVVLGPGYTGEAEVIAAGRDNIIIERNVADMASLMAATDLAISSAGGTALELSYLGVPAIHLVLSEDQLPIAQAMGEAGASINLGRFADVNDEQLWSTLNKLAKDHDLRSSMNRSATAMVDGKGAARIADAVIDTWRQWNAIESYRNRSICAQ